VVAPLAALCVVLLPVVVRRIWMTAPLPVGPLRDLLLAVSRDRKCPVREILIWNTGGTMANAAVVGLARRLRYMLLSDLLLRRLTAPQLAAVARHELAHLRRWHLPLRLAMLLVPVTWWMALEHAWPGLEAWQAGPASALVIPFAMLAYAVIVVGWYSRLLEHDADLDACLSADGEVDQTAAANLCGALIAVCGGSDGGWLQWLHPSLEKRLRFLREIVHRPETGTKLRRQLWRIGAVIALAHLMAAILLAR